MDIIGFLDFLVAEITANLLVFLCGILCGIVLFAGLLVIVGVV